MLQVWVKEITSRHAIRSRDASSSISRVKETHDILAGLEGLFPLGVISLGTKFNYVSHFILFTNIFKGVFSSNLHALVLTFEHFESMTTSLIKTHKISRTALYF